MKKIAILGAGAFGFAIAKIVGENQHKKEIVIYDINSKFIDHIQKTGEHPIFHEKIKLPVSVKATKKLKPAVMDADLIILAIPSKFIRKAVHGFRRYVKDGAIFLNLAKGLEAGTNLRVSEIIDEEFIRLDTDYHTCVLSGGMIANDVTRENPLCAELACEDKDVAKKVAKMLWSDYLRIETSTDLVGVGLAGAFKNVIAIGAGIFDGLSFGESSKSAFVSAAAREMRSLAIEMGADRSTFGPGSQAWFGDLMTTCFGASRNRELGEMIGEGVSVKDAVKDMIANNKSVEGFITTDVVHGLLKKYKVKAPLLNEIHNVTYKKKSPEDFVKHFIKEW